MRTAIRNAFPADATLATRGVHHVGLVYDLLGPPLRHDGSVDQDKRGDWLDACENAAIDPDYRLFFERWRVSFPADETTFREVEATKRLLLGHGNPSISEVGITVDHTWGVPLLTGSALKGLLSHYLDATYGSDDANDGERRTWRGPTWKDRRIPSGLGPGEYHGLLFGAPPVEADDLPGRRGVVDFHDALFVPGSSADKPFARDILNPHQSSYYRSAGANGPPTDWDSPIPVPFITVRPKTRFLLVLTGPSQDWREFALEHLCAALGDVDWGIGGKTTDGYGRLKPVNG
jgi:CRISPR-associated protein Cmr6